MNVEINELKFTMSKRNTPHDLYLKVFKIQSRGRILQESSVIVADESVRMLDIKSFINQDSTIDRKSESMFGMQFGLDDASVKNLLFRPRAGSIFSEQGNDDSNGRLGDKINPP